MIPRRTSLTVVAMLFALAWLSPAPRTASAQDHDRGPTPPRLRFIDGEVSFWRPGAEDWSAAQINTALAAGDSLYAGDTANLEIQIGPRAFVRASSTTEIALTTLDPDYTQFQITGGHAALDLERLPRGQSIEIGSPNAAFTIDRPGYYRVDVDDNGTAFSAARGGRATVVWGDGETTDLAANQEITLAGTDGIQVNVVAAPAPDEWDRWNYDRTARFGEAPRSAPYVPADIAGADELYAYGDWRAQPRYGHVWVPRNVGPGWAPYSTGRWVYDPFYEWTWVDDAPWGWAPYHYGRWVHFNGFWGWAPGPVVVAPVYAPALVAFFGAPGIGVSVSVGLPYVSWCALGYGEPVIPWWGRRGFVGTPYWGGWGGPRVVNKVVIKNKTVVKVTNINNYQNVTVNNAVVAVDRNQFGRGQGKHTHLDTEQVQRLRPVRGELEVQPVSASLVPREERGTRPPDRFQKRQVVNTRSPQDPTTRMRAKGIEPKEPAPRPAPRIVRPQRQSESVRRATDAAPPPGSDNAERAGRRERSGSPPAPAVPEQPSRPQAPRQERAAPQAPRQERAAPQVPQQEPVAPGKSSRPQVPRQKHVAPEQSSRPQVPRQEHVAPEQPSRPQAPRQERAAPEPPSHPQAPREERAAPEPPSRPHAPHEERAAPEPPSRPHAPHEERAAPEPPSHPQPQPQERAAPHESSHQQAPQERAAPHQSSRPQAAPQEPAAPQQPSDERQAPAEPKNGQEAPQRER